MVSGGSIEKVNATSNFIAHGIYSTALFKLKFYLHDFKCWKKKKMA